MTRLYKILISSIILLNGCSKNDPKPNTSTLTFNNNTFTPLSITLNGSSQTIPTGSTLVMTGKPGSSLGGGASTNGQTTSGAQLGGKITWTISNTFPASGNQYVNLNAESSVFFLQVVNHSAYTITKVYVNYGLVNQQSNSLNIPNDGQTYSIGYYYAYTNSNVRLEANGVYWLVSSLGLPFTDNQSFTFNAN